ncbi:hypothetical protein AZI86_01080 [Bdellovibrio bacteriovorus]|uniref:HTH merR-type domain-containing protein n=2 Tax=Bdellovibrio bacteriovorus TaxID=959 RepID=A0A150WN32_BDEBC|nr:hypothetical protein AZI86_01080 [Bdellovibrio bacteriovorus]
MVDLTGATEFLLRSWELRYKVVRPKRTKTGRRMYTDADVMKISKIMQLTRQGFKISQLSSLNLSELQELEVKTHGLKSPQVAMNKKTGALQKVFQSLAKTDWESLKSVFNEERKRLSAADFVHTFIVPVAQHMSLLSLNNGIDIIQEHLLTSLIKESLYSLSVKPSRKKNKFKMIFATIEGDHHDLGLLIAKVIADVHGHECVYLGSHVPKKELSEACVRLRPTHVIIGTSFGSQEFYRESILKYLNFVDRHIPASIALWVGGPGGQGLSLKMERSFYIFKSLEEYEGHICLR